MPETNRVNRDMLTKLHEATKDLDISWFFVKGHDHNFGNVKADELARSVLLEAGSSREPPGDKPQVSESKLQEASLGALVAFDWSKQLEDPGIQKVADQVTNAEPDAELPPSLHRISSSRTTSFGMLIRRTKITSGLSFQERTAAC